MIRMRPYRCLVGALMLGASGIAGAQSVTLRIRPTVGDTLRMQMEQHFEFIHDSSTVDQAFARPMAATVSVCTRSVVVSSSAKGSELESVTDSVTIIPEIARALPLFANTEKALRGRKVRLWVAHDGGISIMNGTKPAPDGDPIGAQMQMPAMLPKTPVSVGETWTRSVRVPVSAAHSTSGLVRVTFKLDSLVKEGELAYVSMKGTFAHTHAKGDQTTPNDSTVGTLIGGMLINQRLGWMTESTSVISLDSTVRPAKGAAPVRVRMKVTQSLRAVSP